MADREWVFFETDAGGSPVQKEIKAAKLDKSESTRLKVLMERVLAGTAPPGDTESISNRPGMFEAKLTGNKRIFRMLYYELPEGSLLAVHFTPKKAPKLPPNSFAQADKRHTDWMKRHPADLEIASDEEPESPDEDSEPDKSDGSIQAKRDDKPIGE